MQVIWSVLSIGGLIGSVSTTVHLLLNYRRPTAAVAWLFAVWALPLVGVILYLMFAVYEGPRRVRRRRQLSRRLRNSGARSSLVESGGGQETLESRTERISRKAGAVPMTHGNEVVLHPDAESARRFVLDSVRGAREEIFLESYIWDVDAFTDEIVEILSEKARQGLRVRVIVDAIGSHTTAGKVARCFADTEVSCAEYLSPNPFKRRFQINFRNHRKLLVIDGALAVAGGRNYGAEYFDDGPDGIRDLSFHVRGPAVGVLRRLFLEDWIVASEGSDDELADVPIPPPAGHSSMRPIPHGCDEACDVFIPIVSTALRRAEQSILIVTPYFLPGPNLLHDLRLAALAGVSVRALIPLKSPERLPDVAARRFFGPLLEAGVEIWLRPDPFLHAKAIVVDNEWALVGSANFDERSIYLNYELSCEVADPEFAQAVTRYFEPDFELSTRLDEDEFAARGWKRRALENAAALLSPIL